MVAIAAIGVLGYAALPETAPELSALVGKWRRPQEQYVLEIKSIGEGGRVDAAYFNPKPIKVESASAKRTDDALELNVVLRDEGYPGSRYVLRYDVREDRLVGTYIRGEGRADEVMFVKESGS